LVNFQSFSSDGNRYNETFLALQQKNCFSFCYREPLACFLSDEVISTPSPPQRTNKHNSNDDEVEATIKSYIAAADQHWRHVGEIFLGFGLTSLMGLERQLRGKSAGLRTHSIVGTTSALVLQVSKYGFSDVIMTGTVVLDPSRIAAQIVSGVSFLGAGLIITRQAAILGLTTAASVWTAAAIGMAAGAGLWLLSLVVTGLHFITVLGFLPLERRLPIVGSKSDSPGKADDEVEESQPV
jgi:uncharacterized membrane protein YhiD involved in acid resistance